MVIPPHKLDSVWLSEESIDSVMLVEHFIGHLYSTKNIYGPFTYLHNLHSIGQLYLNRILL